MRLTPGISAAALVLSISTPSFGQEWIEYASRADFFSVNFPGQPKVQDITYPTEYGITLPGRVHSSDAGPNNRYSVTVVDYANVQILARTSAPRRRPFRSFSTGRERSSTSDEWSAGYAQEGPRNRAFLLYGWFGKSGRCTRFHPRGPAPEIAPTAGSECTNLRDFLQLSDRPVARSLVTQKKAR